jgi:hypothetical protein
MSSSAAASSSAAVGGAGATASPGTVAGGNATGPAPDAASGGSRRGRRKKRPPIKVVTTASGLIGPSQVFSRINPKDLMNRLAPRDRLKLSEFPQLPGESGTFFSSLFGSSSTDNSPAPATPKPEAKSPTSSASSSAPPTPLADVPTGPKVIPKQFWVSDKNVTACYECSAAFSFFNRKQYVLLVLSQNGTAACLTVHFLCLQSLSVVRSSVLQQVSAFGFIDCLLPVVCF